MGTASVKLFNKAVANQILAMEQASLVFEVDQNGGSVSETIGRLLSGEQTFTEMKADVTQDFGFRDEEIQFDYWGCYSHVFNGYPEGSISSLGYLPNQEEKIFLLTQLSTRRSDRWLSSPTARTGSDELEGSFQLEVSICKNADRKNCCLALPTA